MLAWFMLSSCVRLSSTSVCLNVHEDISQTTIKIFVKFFVHVACGRGSFLLWQGDEIPGGRGNFQGLSEPFKIIDNLNLCCSGHRIIAAAFTAKGIIQSPITSFSRRDHSVCQASTNSILKNSGRRRCERGGGIAQHGQSLVSINSLFCLQMI